jgi:hypothetical protein
MMIMILVSKHLKIYTSEDLKWNAFGALNFNSLLVSDP